MGRYKSVLEAEQDTREMPFYVDIPVPDDGLGRKMISFYIWLGIHAKGYWAQHAKTIDRQHFTRYCFSSPWDAKNFEEWLKEESIL